MDANTVLGIAVLCIVAAQAAIWLPLGAFVSKQKNREPSEGAMLGLLFGPFGVLLAALMPNSPNDISDAAPDATYRIVDGGHAIKCLRCRRTSYHMEDVRHLYCAYCKQFHTDSDLYGVISGDPTQLAKRAS